MGHRPAHVPQFGNWESSNETPFTVIFDNARVGKVDGKKFNPNDPEDNPAAFGLKPDNVSGLEHFDDAQHAPSKLQPVVEADRPAGQGGDGHGNSKMGGADRSRGAPPANSAKENSSAADGSRKPPSAIGTRDNTGPEDSPNHQMYEGRLGNKPGSPYHRTASDGGSSGAHSSSVPGKSRLRGSSRADETPDRSATLPKFGAWDENDPSAGEGFTVIFNQHRDEKKQGGPIRVPPLQADHPSKQNHGDGHKQVQGSQLKTSSFWGCCFGSTEAD